MGINCHICIHVPDGDNISLLNAADVRWLSRDKDLRETLGIPDNVNGDFWEHENNDDYQRVLDAALVHKQVLIVELDGINEQGHTDDVELSAQLAQSHYQHQMDIARCDEWIAYYELASTLSKLGHEVMCYGA